MILCRTVEVKLPKNFSRTNEVNRSFKEKSQNQQKELAQFQRSHVAGRPSGVRLPSALAAPQVTRQTIDTDISSPP